MLTSWTCTGDKISLNEVQLSGWQVYRPTNPQGYNNFKIHTLVDALLD